MRALACVVSSALAALVLVGCGNSGGSPLPPTPSSTPQPPSPPPPLATFSVGGYLENWVKSDGSYVTKALDHLDVVYYGFLTLDQAPNATAPRELAWNGTAIFDTYTAMPIHDVLSEHSPATWQKKPIMDLISHCRNTEKTFMWSIGGWSDLKLTLRDEQIPAFVDMVVELLKFGGDGVDFDWEHLSGSKDDVTRTQQRAVLGKTFSSLRKKLDDAGLQDKHISYTSRFNCFWSSDDAPEGAVHFPSDGECLDTFAGEGASPDDVSWVNIMVYDASGVFKDHQLFSPEDFATILNAGKQVVAGKQIVLGFEPGHQAGTGIWEGFDSDFQVIKKLMEEGDGGVMLWAINARSKERSPTTPNSTTYKWQGSIGANAQYMAEVISSLKVERRTSMT